MIIEDPETGLRIDYREGRLADILDPDGNAIDCVQVREYDFASGTFGPEPSPSEIIAQVQAFLDER